MWCLFCTYNNRHCQNKTKCNFNRNMPAKFRTYYKRRTSRTSYLLDQKAIEIIMQNILSASILMANNSSPINCYYGQTYMNTF